VLGFAAWLDRVPWVAAAGPPFRAAVLQGNVPQDRKWEPDVRDATIQRYIDMTRSQRGAQLIVWPETAIPAFYQDIESLTVPRLEADARQYRYDLVFGIPFYDGVADRYFNAVARLGQRRDFYFKRHLVPFGEYLPLRRLLGFMLKLLDVPLADFSPGDGRQPIMHAAGHGVAVTICYEDIFGQQALAGLPEAAYLLNVTNDAWFGNSTAPHQHWQMARMRAIEAGRYMVRAANTGVSGIADASGAVVALAPMFQQAAAAGLVVPLQGQTPYVRFGDVPAIAVVAGILLLQGLWIQRRPNRP
jgi:apolipoprotein N-acyltransferase